jgi:hypothetical protein
MMSRKYRQQGYQDSDRQEDRDAPRKRAPRQDLTMEEKIQRRSIRKATERTANEVVRCHTCGRNVVDAGTIALGSICPHCLVSLHCCRACMHFDSSARRQCRADVREAISNKGEANTCTLFQPRLVLDFTGRRGTTSKTNDPRAAFDNLFRR